jgi:hypothetical protein
MGISPHSPKFLPRLLSLGFFMPIFLLSDGPAITGMSFLPGLSFFGSMKISSETAKSPAGWRGISVYYHCFSVFTTAFNSLSSFSTQWNQSSFFFTFWTFSSFQEDIR